LNCFQGCALQDSKQSASHDCSRPPVQGAFFLSQGDKFVGHRARLRVVSALKIRGRRYTERIHQGGGLADLACVSKRSVGVRQGGIRIAKTPERPRPKGQNRHPCVRAKTRRQWTMLARFIKRDCPIVMCLPLLEVPRTRQVSAHHAVADHERDRRPLLLGQPQELNRKLA